MISRPKLLPDRDGRRVHIMRTYCRCINTYGHRHDLGQMAYDGFRRFRSANTEKIRNVVQSGVLSEHLEVSFSARSRILSAIRGGGKIVQGTNSRTAPPTTGTSLERGSCWVLNKNRINHRDHLKALECSVLADTWILIGNLFQAWSAVIANLEDAMNAFKKKLAGFSSLYENFKSRQEQFRTILEAFPEDSKMLAQVPLLDKLTQAMAENQSPNSVLQGKLHNARKNPNHCDD